MLSHAGLGVSLHTGEEEAPVPSAGLCVHVHVYNAACSRTSEWPPRLLVALSRAFRVPGCTAISINPWELPGLLA